MRSAKPNISRGHELLERRPSPGVALVASASAAVQPKPVEAFPESPDYGRVHGRLHALERLTRLFEQGALSTEEFAAEKAMILRLPAEETTAPEAPARPRRAAPAGPSLTGRMLGWRFLSLSLAVGLAFSYWTQPRETLNYLDGALRLLGA